MLCVERLRGLPDSFLSPKGCMELPQLCHHSEPVKGGQTESSDMLQGSGVFTELRGDLWSVVPGQVKGIH